MKFPFFAVGVMVVCGVAFLLGCSDAVEETDLDPEALRFEIVRINEGELVVEARALAAGSTARSRLPEGGTTFHLLLAVVAEEEDRRIVGQFHFLEGRHDAPDPVVHALDHARHDGM